MLTRLSAGRASIIAGGVIFVVVVTLGIMKLISSPSVKLQKHVTLVYVGAENCAPCDIWQRTQGTAFHDSTEFRRLAYREVKSPSLFDVLKDENWPEDLRVYRKAISQEAGVPLWLVIADDQLVMQSFGLAQWQEAVLPKIKSLLR
jgi:hypothetical protein